MVSLTRLYFSFVYGMLTAVKPKKGSHAEGTVLIMGATLERTDVSKMSSMG